MLNFIEMHTNINQGHLVWMPLHFLEDAEMAEKGLAVNYYTESIYT